MSKKSKRLAYFNPRIVVEGAFDSGAKFSTGSEETCRESLVYDAWDEIGFNKDEQATGKKGMNVMLSFGVPVHGKRYDSYGYEPYYGTMGPDHSFAKKISELKESAEARRQLSSLIDVLVAVPLIIYAGPKAYAGRVNSATYKFHEDEYGYDNDIPTRETEFTYKNATNCMIHHPVLMSIIIGQMRWGIEEFSRGRYATFNKKLKLSFVRTRLRSMAERGKLSAADTKLLKSLYNSMTQLSDSALVKRRLERYPINKKFSRYALRFLESGAENKSLYDSWKSTIGDNLYGTVSQYGFYKWYELKVAKTQAQKNLLHTVRRQAYSDIENQAFMMVG